MTRLRTATRRSTAIPHPTATPHPTASTGQASQGGHSAEDLIVRPATVGPRVDACHRNRRLGPRRCDDQGSASVWVVGCCLALVAVAAVGVARTEAVLARHRAESAADLAALAGAARIGIDGEVCDWSARIARQNGAELVACGARLAPDGRSGQVSVRVRLGVRIAGVGTTSVTASARAERAAAG